MGNLLDTEHRTDCPVCLIQSHDLSMDGQAGQPVPRTRPNFCSCWGSVFNASIRFRNPFNWKNHCCPKEKTTILQGITFYLCIPFIGSISACICVICGKPHDPQMTQMHAEGKQDMNVRARRFQTRIRMAERSKNTIDRGHFFFIATKRCPQNVFPKKSLPIYSKWLSASRHLDRDVEKHLFSGNFSLLQSSRFRYSHGKL